MSNQKEIENMVFNSKFLEIFEGFLKSHNLSLYQTTGGVHLYVSNKNKSGYLVNANPIDTRVLSRSTVTEKNSHWSYLIFPIIESKLLIETIYKKFTKQDDINLLHKNLVKFIHPKDICSYFSYFQDSSIKELDNFLTIKKSANSKQWISEDIFYFVSLALAEKEEKEKSSFLLKVIENNRINLNSIDFQAKLFKFVSLHISGTERNLFSSYYENIEVNKSNGISLFNKPESVVVIDINKAIFYDCMPKDSRGNLMNEASVTRFFNFLCHSLRHKSAMPFLGVENASISQKSTNYKSFRLTVDAKEGKEIDRERIEKYTRFFMDGYIGFKNIPDNKDVISMSEKILSMMSLKLSLPEKSSSSPSLKI